VCFAGLYETTTYFWGDQERMIAWTIASFGVTRLITGIGILRLKRWARVADIIYNWLKVLACGATAVYFIIQTDVGLVLFAVVIGFFGVVALKALHGADAKMLFNASVAPEEREAAGSRIRANRRLVLVAGTFLALVAIVIIAIAIPNSIGAVGGSKQKRTMADMRSIATAWEARATDFNRYNAAGLDFTMPSTPVAYETLSHQLIPTYIKNLPERDGWNHPFEMYDTKDAYAVRSLGKDGKRDAKLTTGTTSDFDCDIIFANGNFVEYPEGHGN